LSSAIQNQTRPAGDEDKRWEIMSKLYCEKLAGLISALDFGEELKAELTVKHYFNGAAVYADKTMCASWSPVGLAFRLPATEVAELIANGQAKPLKYFAKGRIKKGYVLFDNPESKQRPALKAYLLKAADQATLTQVENRA
jgi:TfoX/Sxy family transcriptional regulator of competence genes